MIDSNIQEEMDDIPEYFDRDVIDFETEDLPPEMLLILYPSLYDTDTVAYLREKHNARFK
jgi:hypothetical protein